MKQSSRILYVALLALVSLLLLLMFNTKLILKPSSVENKTGKPLPPELEGEPDIFMEHATITQFASSGDAKYRLYSEQLRHFEREHLTRLAKPRMTLFTKQEPSAHKEPSANKEPSTDKTAPPAASDNTIEPPWIIQSEHGYIRQGLAGTSYTLNQTTGITGDTSLIEGQEIVFLREDVKLSRESSPPGTQMVLSTQTLYVYPHRQFAESDQPVMIDSRVGRTKAAGFTGELKTGILKLVSSKEQRVHTIVLPHQIKQKN